MAHTQLKYNSIGRISKAPCTLIKCRSSVLSADEIIFSSFSFFKICHRADVFQNYSFIQGKNDVIVINLPEQGNLLRNCFMWSL
jgi:hypothetical protein